MTESKHTETKTGYKKTKLGWIPEEWSIKKLNEFGSFSKGKGISKSDIKKKGQPCVLYGDLYTKHKDHIKSFSNFIDQETAEKSHQIKNGDLLFAGSGETAEEIGMCAAYLDDDVAYAGGDIIVFTPQVNDSWFLGYLMNHELVNRQKYKLAQGYSVVHLYSSHLKQISVPLPPLPEQKKIADILSTWDRAIETLEQLIAKKEGLKKGLKQQLLTGEKRFPGFEGEWREVRFKDVVKIDAKSLNSKTSRDYEFEYISLSDVGNGQISNDLEVYQFKEAPSRAKRIVTEGDILMATVRPNLQSFALAKKEHQGKIASTGFTVLSPKKGFNNKYLYHYLFSPHISSQIFALIVGSNYPAINSKDVKKLKIWMPPTKEEVDKIESVLTNIDDEIKILMMQKELVSVQKKGLMQQLLTGKTRV